MKGSGGKSEGASEMRKKDVKVVRSHGGVFRVG
ncbi:protein of unknown function [Mesotoga infera]|uniref:Uncharacterized protein n=1 Tax=Mesotoga infera TaxID=1236046 RepID=A0A7Z7LE98_9BACT|nr:protein of unknown function [Mesotoga infera]